MILRESACRKAFLELCELHLRHMLGPADVIRKNIGLAVDVAHRESELLNVRRHTPHDLVGAHRGPEEVSVIHVDDELLPVEVLAQFADCGPYCETFFHYR
jgi:hypothetical protein